VVRCAVRSKGFTSLRFTLEEQYTRTTFLFLGYHLGVVVFDLMTMSAKAAYDTGANGRIEVEQRD
jgi:hypothetical protein